LNKEPSSGLQREETREEEILANLREFLTYLEDKKIINAE